MKRLMKRQLKTRHTLNDILFVSRSFTTSTPGPSPTLTASSQPTQQEHLIQQLESHYQDALKLIEQKDFKQGISSLIRIANQNHPNANAQLGFMLSKGIEFTKEPSRAIFFLDKADQLGVVEASFQLGSLYMSGEGCVKDPLKAQALYLKAAHSGLAIAQHNVASYYFEDKKVWKAIEYWKMASENEMQLSMINLGNLYLKGSFEGVEKVEIDFKEAKKYFEMALVGRNIVLGKDAQVCLDRMKVLESSDVKKEGSKCFLM